MTRLERIRQALELGYALDLIDGHYIDTLPLRGRRWTVWGRGIGAYEVDGGAEVLPTLPRAACLHAPNASRQYTTKQVEAVVERLGLTNQKEAK